MNTQKDAFIKAATPFSPPSADKAFLSPEQSNRLFENPDSLQTASIKNLKGVNLTKKRLVRAQLANFHFFESNLSGCLLSSTQMPGAHLQVVESSKTFANRINLEGATLSHVNLTLTELNKANFKDTKLDYVFFMGADLREADFSGVQCGKGVFFTGAAGIIRDNVPPGGIWLPEVLEDKIRLGEFSKEELRYFKAVFEQSKEEVYNNFQFRSVTRKPYLTESHTAWIGGMLKVINAALAVAPPRPG